MLKNTFTANNNVSAANISVLSAASDFHYLDSEVLPTTKEIIEKIFSKFTPHIPQKDAGTADSSFVSIAASELKKARKLEEFKEILANVPEGFCLTPVKYIKVDAKQNKAVMEEFLSYVQEPFLEYLANTHSDELETLGISQHGIEKMKDGILPEDENGVSYPFNVDHIFERSGGGTRSLEEEVDPHMPPRSAPTRKINNFKNLFLMPKFAHDFKNKLNNLQEISQIKVGESKWVLMIVPEATYDRSGFIALPQKSRRSLHDLDMSSASKSKFARKKAKQASRAIENILNSTTAVIDHTNTLNEGQITSLEENIKKTTMYLNQAFNAAVQSDGESHALNLFSQIYGGPEVGNFRKAVEELPLSAAVKASEALQNLEKDILFAKKAMKQRNNLTFPDSPKH